MLSWILGVLFALVGMVSVFSEPIPGIVMLVMAAVLLPPVTRLVDQKWKFHLSGGVKIAVIFIGFIIFGKTIDTSNVSTTPQYNTDNEIVTDDVTTAKQVKEEQPPTRTNEPNSNETETIPASDQNKVKVPEEIKPATATDVDRKPTPPTTEENSAPTPSETVSQRNAVRSAKAYLNFSAFSHDGLVAQLEYEKFSHADAIYGADNSGANWNEQAAKSAKQYLEQSAFSRSGLIDQLLYEKYTREQAEYGVNAVGL